MAVTQLADGPGTADAAEAEGEAAVTVAEVVEEPVADVTDGAGTEAKAAPADGVACFCLPPPLPPNESPWTGPSSSATLNAGPLPQVNCCQFVANRREVAGNR